MRTSSATTPFPPELRLLVLARCVNRLGGFSMAFLGVLLVRELGAGAGETALVLTCFGVATIPSRILGGHLADAWGHRPTMLLGLVGCALAQVVVAVAPDLSWALVGAVLLGLAYEVVEPPTQALVSDLMPEQARAFGYSALNASLAVAGVLAGVVAAAVAGLGLRWLFVVDAATCLACAALVAARLRLPPPVGAPVAGRTFRDDRDDRHGRDRAADRGGVPHRQRTRDARDERDRAAARGGAAHRQRTVDARGRWTAALRDRRLRPVVGFGTVVATVTMVVVFGVPLLVEQRGLAPAVTGWVLAAGAAASVPGAWLAAVLRRRTDDTGLLLVGEVTAAVGLGTIALTSQAAGLAAGLVAFDVGSLLVIATTMARAGTIAPEGSRGTYLALLGLTWGLATSVAPLVLTTLGTAYGPGAPFTAAALALLGTAFVRAAQRPRLRRRTSLGGLPPAYDREGSTT